MTTWVADTDGLAEAAAGAIALRSTQGGASKKKSISANVAALLAAADYAAVKTLLSLGTMADETAANYYTSTDTDTEISGAISAHVAVGDPHTQYKLETDFSANGASLVGAADYAAMRALLDLEAGTDFLSPAAVSSAISTALGDYTATASLGALALLNTVGTSQIDNDAVDFTKLLNATGAGFIGATAAGAFSERTPTQVTAALDAMVGDSGSGGTKGLVPAPAAGDAAAGKYLDADGTWTVPAGGGGGSAYGKQDEWVPVEALRPRYTNGPQEGGDELTTNKVVRRWLDFDPSTAEYAQFIWRMPKRWNESTVTFRPVWSHGSTTTNFGVVWSLSGVALSNDDAMDAAQGTAQTSTDTGGTTDDYYEGPESSAITIAGTPAENDLVVFEVSRVVGDGSDTMAIDARLLGLVLHITTNAETDA
jgi:hypothetical protein